MRAYTFNRFDPARVPSPCFVIDEVIVEHNLGILARVQEQSGAKVLAALKAFSCWHLAPLISRYLTGTCSSGLHEARLAHEYFKGEVHVFSAGFSAQDFSNIVPIADHIVFNSISQLERFLPLCNNSIQVGLRVNPEHSEGAADIYNPCAPGSRLGIPASQLTDEAISHVSGLHFHTLCEQGFDALANTLDVFEDKFGHYLSRLKWVNFGGGHLITDPDYDVNALIKRLKLFSQHYDVQVYIEPGEAIAIRSGVLVSEVLDVAMTDRQQVILDASATCHMPDTLEMPYRADIFQSGLPSEKAHDYRLGGLTCLAGDVMGDYSFDKPLNVGDRLMFDDMAHYTMVKTSTFNGVSLPAIAVWNSSTDALSLIKTFDYNDFKHRLS